MRLVAIVGTNADFSFNRLIEKFMANHYKDEAEIEILEINDLPRFKNGASENDAVLNFRKKVSQADGVIISTPEYDHGITAPLKNAMEWLGKSNFDKSALYMKPVMVLGGSYGIQGASRAQEDMREILLSPDLTANVLPGNEVLIGHVADKFDKETGKLVDQDTIKEIDQAFSNFVKFVDQSKK
ncbi:NAD(P)H-dependent oxidoreductase [Lactobacillus sp. PV037]|uniref:NADPH-dependent FMN reductase n=1 Tax=Lactobacillus sp. PV037 TaxID=2594496 RepID=UPI00223F33FC|nr:NADPH-dependent FMN reductase [Lactobacillus sp. PV037]QNQ83064.1 NAD(P)H-dependent oxidoreductase [Lactobacillus sp. PV037]